MNQRSKRARDRKRAETGQDLSASAVNTGGFVSMQRRGETPEVRMPEKATGDVPAEKASGLAKASPFFRAVKDALNPRSKEEEQKAIAESTESKDASSQEDEEDETTE